jgi:hypothetical protein
MTKLIAKQKILIAAVGMVLLSILLMIIVIPGVYTKTLPNENNLLAVIGILLAIVIRLLLIIWIRSIIKTIKYDGDHRKAVLIIIAILLIIFGLIYSDGAFAFLDNEHVIYISYLMFTSVFFDIIASILTFIAGFLKSQKVR